MTWPISQTAGLGLYLSHRLAEAMGGALTYRHDGTWARFVLSLATSKSEISSILENGRWTAEGVRGIE